MKKCSLITVLLVLMMVVSMDTWAQCSICTRTASQLGEGPAQGFNSGIIYLALTPFLIIGYVSYRWWKNQDQ